jgi:2-polyprenyl-3-methyl-5-hydroxy-6-metoxy-1,4-benzoquinol methylase
MSPGDDLSSTRSERVLGQTGYNIPERVVPGTADWQKGLADHMQRYEFASRFCEGKRVLDAGCGVGYGANLLVQRGAAFVQGVDKSEVALEVARQRFSTDLSSFMADDLEILSQVTGKFDVVVALECIEHLRAPIRFLTRCGEILGQSGTLVLSTPNAKGLGRSNHGRPINPFHVTEYTYGELRKLLTEHFGVVTMYHQVKSPLLELYEDTARFVGFAYRTSPTLRAGLWLRRLVGRSGHDPVVRPWIHSPLDYQICAEIPVIDRAWVFIAVCSEPR